MWILSICGGGNLGTGGTDDKGAVGLGWFNLKVGRGRWLQEQVLLCSDAAHAGDVTKALTRYVNEMEYLLGR